MRGNSLALQRSHPGQLLESGNLCLIAKAERPYSPCNPPLAWPELMYYNIGEGRTPQVCPFLFLSVP